MVFNGFEMTLNKPGVILHLCHIKDMKVIYMSSFIMLCAMVTYGGLLGILHHDFKETWAPGVGLLLLWEIGHIL